LHQWCQHVGTALPLKVKSVTGLVSSMVFVLYYDLELREVILFLLYS